MKQIFLLLLTLGLLASCERGPDYEEQGYIDVTVEGRIIDVYTQQPIDSAIVQLHAALRPTGYPGPVSHTFLTDASGYYRFDFKADLDSGYQVSAIADKYYTNLGVSYSEHRVFNGNRPTSGAYRVQYHNPWRDKFNKTISLVPSATLRVHLVNKNGVYDRFGMNTPPGSPLGNNIWVSGTSVNQYYDFVVYGGTEINLDTFRYEPGEGPGQGDYVQIPIICLPHQVNEILIEY